MNRRNAKISTTVLPAALFAATNSLAIKSLSEYQHYVFSSDFPAVSRYLNSVRGLGLSCLSMT